MTGRATPGKIKLQLDDVEQSNELFQFLKANHRIPFSSVQKWND